MSELLTIAQLKKIVPGAPYLDHWYAALIKLLPEYEINTRLRIAAFLAQCGHESGDFKFIRENLNYSWQGLRKTFPKYFPTDAAAKKYERNPQAIASKVYANRMGNGDEASQDGWKYRGRGLIQVTGKTNCQEFADSLEISIDEATEYLETFEGAVQGSCWFWESNNLNALADKGDIVSISKKVNGGDHGMADRIVRYNNALIVLSKGE